MEAEWGGNVRFLSHENVTLYDSDGNEIKESICPKCGIGMTCVIGENAYAFICSKCSQNNKD